MTVVSKSKKIWFVVLMLSLAIGLEATKSEIFAAEGRDTSLYREMWLNDTSSAKGHNVFLKNVSHILIFVNFVWPHTGETNDKVLPEPIRKKHLKKTLMAMLEKFSSGTPVTNVDSFNDFKKYNELGNKKDTLTLSLQVVIKDSDSFKPALLHNVAGIYLNAYRPGMDFQSSISQRTPEFLLLNEDNDLLEKRIAGNLDSWMRWGK